jgi:hypothetical protein
MKYFVAYQVLRFDKGTLDSIALVSRKLVDSADKPESDLAYVQQQCIHSYQQNLQYNLQYTHV